MLDTLDVPRDDRQEVVVPADALKQLLVTLFVHKSLFAADAEIAAARLIEADLRGIHSHGSRAVWRYLKAIDEGHIDPRARVLTLSETPAMAVLDGSRALGHVAATRAMELAIRKAREVGTGTVAVRNSQHYGAASVYALLATQAGMIGYTTTSTGKATVAGYGSREPATANNAFAWGVPMRSGPPFVLDMACAVTSWGKVESLKLYGHELPPGWAFDGEGRPTVIPGEARTLLPAAGARGYGLAFLCSVLAGPLVNGRMPLHKTRSPEIDGSEHFFYCLDPAAFGDRERFDRELEVTAKEIRALAPAEGFDRVRLPGELEWERTERWRREGIPLHREHVANLEELARGMNVPFPWKG
ncbi:MAG TPA: Ldh family oxidoreductase [Planctomycetaceae bacterium]|nr:Ldh family oxidoreductase [Planctomycetaceae bacterium]